MPRYRNNPISIAAKLAPGIPNSTVGMNEEAFCALLAPSAPTTPLTFPLPNFSLGLAATVAPYANQSAIAPPSPGSSPMNDPTKPPLNESLQHLTVSRMPCHMPAVDPCKFLCEIVCFLFIHPSQSSGMANSPA